MFEKYPEIDKAILLANLRGMLESMPDWANYSPTSTSHHTWIAQTNALLKRWSALEAMQFGHAGENLAFRSMRDNVVGQIHGILHRAIADLELTVPKGADQAFGPGAVYDFFKALSAVMTSAIRSVFVIDAYLDEDIFDYVLKVNQGVTVRLLGRKHGERLKAAKDRFVQQYRIALELRLSSDLHDRIVFIDSNVCWVMGQSIRDAATVKATYLAPLSPDIAQEKLTVYEAIWNNARLS